MIYIVTVISHEFFPRHIRSWGYYTELSDAQDALDNDTFSMSECIYNYAVIESCAPGIPARCEAVEWRKYDNTARGNKPKWVTITEAPKRMRGTMNFGLG